MALVIDVISDFVCPWCWIGKRNMDVLAGEFTIVRRWRPYLLHPAIPRGGLPRDELVRQKFGSEERARDLAAGVAEAGRSAGLDINYALIDTTPDTRDAHRLMRWAGGQARADAVAEGLFRAYFSEGCNIGDAAVLADIGAGAGLDRPLLEDLFAADADRDIIDAQAARARELGVSGVPTYVFADKFALVGAQPVEYLRKAAQKAAAAA
jgi:predicted DsbA family dithiol-disulfide isomerase